MTAVVVTVAQGMDNELFQNADLSRPARKPRRKPHKHNDSKANKYDVQPKPKN